MRYPVWIVLIVALLVAGCGSGDDGQATTETKSPAATTSSTATVTTAAVEAGLTEPSARHRASMATINAIDAILADPYAYGSTEAEIVAALSAHVAEGAVMDDDVFGPVDWTIGFSKTLFEGSMDARVDGYDKWVSDDGSQGGVLWVWYGTNLAGNPFELVGISLNDFDENGKIAYELVSYPYPDEYVEEAVGGAGTVLASTHPGTGFSFVWDDLCEWITTDALAEMVAAAYGWDNVEVPPGERLSEHSCRWWINGERNGMYRSGGIGLSELDDSYLGGSVVQWATSLQPGIGDFVVGHPDMSDGAAYMTGAFGYFAVGVPDDDHYLQLDVAISDDALAAEWPDPTIRLGDLILHELGWLD